MINFIKNFRAEESGAVTVDWVVLTAAVVALALAVVSVLNGSVKDLAQGIVDDLGSASTQIDSIRGLNTP